MSLASMPERSVLITAANPPSRRSAGRGPIVGFVVTLVHP
jgi:hypothetical protein